MAQSPAVRVAEGDYIDYSPGAAFIEGEVIVQNGLLGVAWQPIVANVLGSLSLSGVFDFPKVTGAVNAGQIVYWDATGSPVTGDASSGAATTTEGANTFIGRANVAAASGDSTVRVRLFGLAGQTIYGNMSTPIADPGDAGAIPVTGSGYVSLVSTGAETRTLAAPTFIGQELLLYFKTDGGDCVVTCATTVNETANNTITFTDTGEYISLVAVEEGANLRWRAVGNDGAALTTV